MGMGGRSDPPRVLCVYGTESGNAKRGIQTLQKKWEKRGATFKICSVVEGNAVGDLAELPSKYDVLIISTSSFGEGDPPENFKGFLLSLYRAQKAQDKPVAGMQHAVLGYGASVYETFQNVPRLADKMLEECGSRRLAQRCELDEGADDDTGAKLQAFEDAVFSACQALPDASAKPPCSWKVPACDILEKTEDDLQMDALEKTSGATIGLAVLALAGAVGFAYSNGYI